MFSFFLLQLLPFSQFQFYFLPKLLGKQTVFHNPSIFFLYLTQYNASWLIIRNFHTVKNIQHSTQFFSSLNTKFFLYFYLFDLFQDASSWQTQNRTCYENVWRKQLESFLSKYSYEFDQLSFQLISKKAYERQVKIICTWACFLNIIVYKPHHYQIVSCEKTCMIYQLSAQRKFRVSLDSFDE